MLNLSYRKKRSCEKTQLHLFQGINRRSGKQVARGMRHNVLSRGGHEVAVGKSPPGRVTRIRGREMKRWRG